MERYFVHVSDGHTFELRRRFSELEDAKTHASIIANDLAQEDGWHGYCVIVTDVHGTEFQRVPVFESRR
jgi:hypothetical protein